MVFYKTRNQTVETVFGAERARKDRFCMCKRVGKETGSQSANATGLAGAPGGEGVPKGNSNVPRELTGRVLPFWASYPNRHGGQTATAVAGGRMEQAGHGGHGAGNMLVQHTRNGRRRIQEGSPVACRRVVTIRPSDKGRCSPEDRTRQTKAVRRARQLGRGGHHCQRSSLWGRAGRKGRGDMNRRQQFMTRARSGSVLGCATHRATATTTAKTHTHMISLAGVLRVVGLLLLANAAYSRHELNQLAFIVAENTVAGEGFSPIQTPQTLQTLPLDVLLELVCGAVLVLGATLVSLFTSAEVCPASTTVVLKNGHWVVDTRRGTGGGSQDQHPLRAIDVAAANTAADHAGMASYAYLDTRANFVNLTKRALAFAAWASSNAEAGAEAI